MALIDEFTREYLATRLINNFSMLQTIIDIMLLRGVPEHIRSYSGTEMIAKVVRNWLTQVSKTLLIVPGSPWDNDCCKSLNRKLRD